MTGEGGQIGVEAGATRGQGWSVLIVDDDPEIRNMIQVVLAREGDRASVGGELGEPFLALVRRWLEPGGIFAFIDSRPDTQSGAVDHDPPLDDIQIRRLEDGSSFRVRKVHYSPEELEVALAKADFRDVRVESTDRFFLLGSAER